MSARASRSIGQRKLSAELRQLREVALLTAEQVSQELGWSPSKLSRIENSRIRLKSEDVGRLLALYNVAADERQRLLALLADDPRKKWWEAYADVLPLEYLSLISFESEASAAKSFESMAIPGLLQTEAYSRAIIGMWQSIDIVSPAEVERRTRVRMTRQRVLTAENPLEFSAVIDEAVLCRQVADREVMRDQLRHLVEVSRLPNVKLQVLRLAGKHAISSEPFLILQIPDFGDVAYVEHLLDSRVYVDDSTPIFLHSLVFEKLRDASESTSESRRIIEEVADRVWSTR